MLIFISCAKTMKAATVKHVPAITLPRFEEEARHNALAMLEHTPEELAKLLHVNAKIAAENYLRFREFHAPDIHPTPALCTYTGAVFKRISVKDFTTDDFLYAQQHLLITSFLYGLLRPLDGIRLYRMEGNVRLHDGRSMFDYWKPLLTDYFIDAVKREGGILVNLASAEMKDLFDWKRVEDEVTVVTPEFQVWKGDQLKTVVMYAKMCRGEMTRFILKNRLEEPSDLRLFRWEGFTFDESRSTTNHLLFTC